MKTKITILVGAVALITLSFTFVSVEPKGDNNPSERIESHVSSPVGGMIADEVVK